MKYWIKTLTTSDHYSLEGSSVNGEPNAVRRKTYYSANVMKPIDANQKNGGDYPLDDTVVSSYEVSNLISSESYDGTYHLPVIDIDVESDLIELPDDGYNYTVRVPISCATANRVERLRNTLIKYNLILPDSLISVAPDNSSKEHVFLTIPFSFPGNAFRVPSSSPGHSHLYLDHPLNWSSYHSLLISFVRCGIVEESYYNIAKARGKTLVRKPGVYKVYVHEKLPKPIYKKYPASTPYVFKEHSKVNQLLKNTITEPTEDRDHTRRALKDAQDKHKKDIDHYEKRLKKLREDRLNLTKQIKELKEEKIALQRLIADKVG
jgi:hypothetical protein